MNRDLHNANLAAILLVLVRLIENRLTGNIPNVKLPAAHPLYSHFQTYTPLRPLDDNALTISW